MKDINCDLGEGEPLARTRALLRVVTSANIACGGHAGDVRAMRTCLRLCREFGVRAGAHPGFAGRENFGRRELPLGPRELETLLLQQLGAFVLAAAAEKIQPHHVKLHGALYHVVERSPALARTYAQLVGEYFPGWRIYAAPEGRVAAGARKAGVEVWREVFADRAYLADGRLAPRGSPGAVISSPAEIRSRMAGLKKDGILTAQGGAAIRVEAETVCVHGDSPNSLQIAKIVSAALSVPRRAGR